MRERAGRWEEINNQEQITEDKFWKEHKDKKKVKAKTNKQKLIMLYLFLKCSNFLIEWKRHLDFIPVMLTTEHFLFCIHTSTKVMYYLWVKGLSIEIILYCVYENTIIIQFHCISESIQPNIPSQTLPPFYLNFTFL